MVSHLVCGAPHRETEDTRGVHCLLIFLSHWDSTLRSSLLLRFVLHALCSFHDFIWVSVSSLIYLTFTNFVYSNFLFFFLYLSEFLLLILEGYLNYLLPLPLLFIVRNKKTYFELKFLFSYILIAEMRLRITIFDNI